MTKLYVERAEFTNGELTLDRDIKKRVVKVMRLGVGDPVEVLTPGRRYECSIAEVVPDGIRLRLLRELEAQPASKLTLILGQAIPKGDRFEWLIQKATELGVAEIIPLVTRHTIVRPDSASSKVQRWNEIAAHAAEQCESGIPTRIHAPQSLKDFLATNRSGAKFLLHERAGADPLRKVLASLNDDRITFVVGPEGGWSSEEAAELEKSGFARVHLGNRILRSETAGLALAAILQYQSGDFST